MPKMKVFLAGHNGMIGSAIYKKLKKNNFKILIARREQLDLTDQDKVYKFLKKNKPKKIIIAAAKVGGIKANIKYPAEYIYENLAIQNNLIHGAYKNQIKDIIFLGSSCIYPKNTKQPMKETSLLTGKPEETNLSYALAKIAGIYLCQSYNAQYKTNYISLIPSNVYGPKDNFNLETSHFYAAIINKFHLAKKNKHNSISLLGNPNTRRELTFSEDVADACLYFLRKKPKNKIINIGSGKDYTIKEYANLIMKEMNLNLKIKFNGKYSGIKKKLLDVRLMKKYGFKTKTNLKDGFKSTYKYYLSNIDHEK